MTVEEYNYCVDEFFRQCLSFYPKNIRDVDKAKDIVQDSYEKLWIKVETVCLRKSQILSFTTAYHTMIDLLRREKKFGDYNTIKHETYSHTEQYSDLNEILHEAIKLLPETQRSVIMLRDYEGYTYEEIAEVTGLNESQVKVLYL